MSEKKRKTYSNSIEINQQTDSPAVTYSVTYTPMVRSSNGKLKPSCSVPWSIQIELSEQYAKITTNNEPTEQPPEKIYSGKSKYLCAALKKVKMLHLVLFGKSLITKKYAIKCYISGCSEPYDKDEKEIGSNGSTPDDPLYSMIDENADCSFANLEIWRKQEFIKKFFELPLVETEPCWSAFNAYLFGKSKRFESDKLVYNWMAFNAILNEYYHFEGDAAKVKKFVKDSQKGNTRHEYRIAGKKVSGSERIKEVEKEICMRIRTKVLASPNINKKLYDLKDEKSEISSKIKQCYYQCSESKKNCPYKTDYNGICTHTDCPKYIQVETDYTPSSFLIYPFTYKLRCGLFHGSRPMPVFSYKDVSLLNSYAVSNYLLEEYIDKELPALFVKRHQS